MYLVLVPAVIALEQLVRAWKWRQILHPLRAVGTPDLARRAEDIPSYRASLISVWEKL